MNCQVCESESRPSKYTCPSCSIKSCSLECVRKHKTDNDCDGFRQHTFVPMSEFTDTELQNDISFLTRVKREAKGLTRPAPYEIKSKKGNFSKKVRAMYEWKELPNSFTRHRENKSFCTKSNCVFWSVEVILHAEDGTVEKTEVKQKISETECVEILFPEDMKSMKAFYKKHESQVRLLILIF
jgi:hypothetical protein